MKIGDIVYFAPSVKFSGLDLSGKELPEQFDSRIRGFYLEPAEEMADSSHALASGLLVVSCVDALARLRSTATVGHRFCTWIRDELPSFHDAHIARRFYDEFRNGLVHEARIKNGGQFSLEQAKTVDTGSGVLSINPKYLVSEVGVALQRYIFELKAKPSACNDLLKRLKKDFQYELSE